MVHDGEPLDRVSDATFDNWVYRLLPRAAWPYAQLARWDRPIGWQLLMWPCFWSAALAANAALPLGLFSWKSLVWHLVLFFIGSVAMRGAGCTYNDLVDHRIDIAVARTRSRPLPSGRVSRRQAKAFIVAQAHIGLAVLVQFNGFAIVTGLASLIFVAIYPFAKRFTHWPQFFLGLAFCWGGLMGWAGQFASLALAPMLLYAAAIAWTIGYDTIYAHQDKEDDRLAGIGSTALLFGNGTKGWLVFLYGTSLMLMALSFFAVGVNLFAYGGLAAAAFLMVWQVLLLKIDDAERCRVLFRANHPVGALIFSGLLLPLVLA